MAQRAALICMCLADALLAASVQQIPISEGDFGGGKPAIVGESRDKSPFTGDFDRYVEGVMDEWKLAGMAVAVVDGEDVFTQAYGYSVLPDQKATPETLWYAGSTTKAQVGATLSHLIDSKEYSSLKLGWTTPISSIIRDDFVLQDQWDTDHLTLDDAACHRTGMPTHDYALRKRLNSSTPLRDTVRNLRNLPIQKNPRVEWHYNNHMWLTLSYVVETVTGRPLRDMLKKVIWDPLNMTSTFIDLDKAQDSGLVLSRGYWYNKHNESYVPMEFMPTAVVSGGGATISTVVDYAKWIKALLYQDEFLSEASHADIIRPRAIAFPDAALGQDITTYAAGWFRTVFHGEKTIWHSGSTATHGALVYWLPDRKYGVVIMGNYASEVPRTVMYRLLEDKLGIPNEKRFDINEVSRKSTKSRKDALANAPQILFPSRPSHGLPPTIKIADLQGTYHHQGYGTIELIEEAHPKKEGEKVLVAYRPEALWPLKLTLEHASGDYWTVYVTESEDNPEVGKA
ncbi:hypothetical protein QQS21_012156, partial [Conoideocrella luteorostrata]